MDGYEPCAGDYMTAWLNSDAVKKAIHVKGDIKWQDCSRTIRCVWSRLFECDLYVWMVGFHDGATCGVYLWVCCVEL